MIHVSVDVEALGEVLVSVGACRFDLETGETFEEFYRVLDVQAQLGLGLKPSGDAFRWWLKQSDAARKAVADWPATPPRESLEALVRWMAIVGAGEKFKGAWVWAYPTSFDLPLIERVCRAFELPCPWYWPQTIDGRTLWQVALTLDPRLAVLEREAVLDHHALADAKRQAAWYAAYWRALGPMWPKVQP